MHRVVALALLGLTVLTWGAQASDSDGLRRATEKWRSARGESEGIEVYLRRVVASDSAFNHDPGLAVQHLGPDMRREYDALQYLLTTTLKSQFLGLSTDELRAEWLRRYWRLNDPTPTTPENERQREHDRRVAEVAPRFRARRAARMGRTRACSHHVR